MALCLGLLGFDSRASRATAVLLAPPSVLFLVYALFRYRFRAFLIRTGASEGYDDALGPTLLTLVVVAALIMNMVMVFGAPASGGGGGARRLLRGGDGGRE